MEKILKSYNKPKLTIHGDIKHITKAVDYPGATDNPYGCSGAGCP